MQSGVNRRASRTLQRRPDERASATTTASSTGNVSGLMHHRSVGGVAAEARRPRPAGLVQSNSYPGRSESAMDVNGGLRRNNSRRIADGIKRRFGSIWRKKPIEAVS